MAKFYYTYGTSENFPFNGGWTEINAENRDIADNIFKMFHPNRPECKNYLNCACVYDEESFQNTKMYKGNNNLGSGCQECIDLTRTIYNSETIIDSKFNIIGVRYINVPNSTANVIQKAYFPETDSNGISDNITAAVITVELCSKKKYVEHIKHINIAFSEDGGMVTISIIYKNDAVENQYPYRNEALSLAKNIYEQMRTMDVSNKNEIFEILRKYIF